MDGDWWDDWDGGDEWAGKGWDVLDGFGWDGMAGMGWLGYAGQLENYPELIKKNPGFPSKSEDYLMDLKVFDQNP